MHCLFIYIFFDLIMSNQSVINESSLEHDRLLSGNVPPLLSKVPASFSFQ